MSAIENSSETIVRAFLNAINAQDAIALTALLSPEHRMIDALGGVVEGREKVGECWKQYFRMVPDYSVDIEEIVVNGSTVVLFGIAQGTLALDGVLLPENRWRTPLAVRVTVEEGQIAEWRIFADNEPIRSLIARHQNVECIS